MDFVPEGRVHPAKMEKTEAQAGALVFLSETFHHARDRVFAGDIGRGIAHRGLAEDAGDRDEEALFRRGHHLAGFAHQQKGSPRVDIHHLGEFGIGRVGSGLDQANARAVNDHINRAEFFDSGGDNFFGGAGGGEVGGEMRAAGKGGEFFLRASGEKYRVATG